MNKKHFVFPFMFSKKKEMFSLFAKETIFVVVVENYKAFYVSVS